MNTKLQIRNVRLKKIIIENFKNVHSGEISLKPNKGMSTAEVLGIYGQNGSGKTSVIDAISVLKTLLCGQKLPDNISDSISVNEEQTLLSYTFHIGQDDNSYTSIEYIVRIGRKEELQESNVPDNLLYDPHHVSCRNYPVVCNEKIYIQVVEEGIIKERKTLYIDTDSEASPFLPASKYEELFSRKEQNKKDLLITRATTYSSSKSFVFSSQFLNVLRKSCNDHFFLENIESIVNYGNFRLFVFGGTDVTMLKLNYLPIAFDYKKGLIRSSGNIGIPVNGNGLLSQDAYEIASNLLESMNTVLKAVIPNLTVSMEILGTEIAPDNQEMYRVQLFSNKNESPIPFCYESEGIKKIFSVLNLLINVYNCYSFTVAIDEMDSGVFEYLLGELLSIISTRGKGQLIFTSHNLRPLEVLDRQNVIFTTTNPSNRYICPTYIKATNNLRDFYYRDIMLGEWKEDVYERTDNSEIAFAFRKAGEYCGS